MELILKSSLRDNKGLTRQEINEFENFVKTHFGNGLPQKFKDLYMQYNGGVPNKNALIDDGGGVSCFDSIKEIERTITSLNLDENDTRLPRKSLMVFADDGTGLLYALELGDEEYGKVFCIEEYDEIHSLTANSFEEFLNMLVEDDFDWE